ncbi:MAG: MmgE/PrpD family protein [Chloroflexota bacterium]
MKITMQLAEFVAETDYPQLPPKAIAAAKRSITDCTGTAIAGSLEPVAKKVAAVVKKLKGVPQASVIGAGFKTSSLDAALANGAAAHALDYDDVCSTITENPVTIHLTAAVLPALLALGEEVKASGREIIAAYVLAYEVASRLANAMGPDYGDDLGWHPTAPLGTVAAAAGAAKLLKLSPRKTAIAIGIATSQAAGIRQNFGTMVKPFHMGNASRSGILSARLAREGFTAALDSLEGRYGFCHAFSGGRGYDVKKIVEDLGNPFQVVAPGPTIKLYPCCGSAHGALNAFFSLLQKHDFEPEKVHSIDVTVPFDPPRSLIHDNPKNALEGKFSLQYCLAAALVDRKVGLSSFADNQVLRPEVKKLFSKIKMARQPGMEGKPSWQVPEYVVSVKMENGKTYSEKARVPFIAPIQIATQQEMADKYHDCASLVLSSDDVTASLNILETLEKTPDISRLTGIIGKPKAK